MIYTDPDGAYVMVNNKDLGDAPQQYQYSNGASFRVLASKDGYFDSKADFYADSPELRDGVIHMSLRENPVWRATTTSRATNVWLRVQINEKFSESDVWQRVIDSVTSAYDSLEQLDPSSGYIRSTERQRTWDLGGKQGRYTVRTQVIGSIASAKPLIYKFKLKSEYSTGGADDWQPYGRVFHEDAEMIEELTNRLGLK